MSSKFFSRARGSSSSSEAPDADLPHAQARVVVGLDFGTTFSGFAFAHSSKPKEVNKFVEWPETRSAGVPQYCKTQTSLYYRYCEDGSYLLSAWGWPAQVAYREDVTEAARAARHGGQPLANRFLTKFKLHLAGEETIRTSRLGPSTADPLPYGLTPEQVVTDYLREIGTHIMNILQLRYGEQLTIQEVKWCLTVPALWGDDAKLKMVVCSEKAGLVQGHHTPPGVAASPHPIDIVLEPEAAALACWSEPGSHLEIGKGEHLLVADIGGGTVDIVVHERVNQGSEELNLKEVAPSSGGLCGGTFVDQAYLNLLKERIPCFQELVTVHGRVLIQILKQWHEFKSTYDGGPKSRLVVEIPSTLTAAWKRYDRENGLSPKEDEEYEELRLKNSDIEGVFHPTVSEIMRLIHAKMTREVKVLMVVGGFSASPYLMARIKSELGHQVRSIINPNDPGAAICSGAVLTGLNPRSRIVSRISKKWYGLKVSKEFDGSVHPKEKRFKDDRKVYMCADLLQIYVEMGEEVDVESTKSFNFNPLSKKAKHISFELFSSSEMPPPMFTTDKGVSCVGSFEMDISDGLKVGRERLIKVTMQFGRTTIDVRGQRVNFGDKNKVDTFKFVFEVS